MLVHTDHESPDCSHKARQTFPVSNNTTAVPSRPSSHKAQWVEALGQQRQWGGHRCGNAALGLHRYRAPVPAASATATSPAGELPRLQEGWPAPTTGSSLAPLTKPWLGRWHEFLFRQQVRQGRPPLACVPHQSQTRLRPCRRQKSAGLRLSDPTAPN